MTPKQREILDQLEDELRIKRGTLPIRGESEGYVFTEVNGVTVLITRTRRNHRGGYKVPAVCTYDEVFNPTNLDAARYAWELFSKQAPVTGRYGHRNPIISPKSWKCGNASCPCASEERERLIRRSGARPNGSV